MFKQIFVCLYTDKKDKTKYFKIMLSYFFRIAYYTCNKNKDENAHRFALSGEL